MPCVRGAVVFAFPCSVGCVCCVTAGQWCDFCRQGFLFWPLLSVITCGSGGLVPGGSSVNGSAGVGVLGVQVRQWRERAAAAVAGAAQALSCARVAGDASLACAGTHRVPGESAETCWARHRALE